MSKPTMTLHASTDVAGTSPQSESQNGDGQASKPSGSKPTETNRKQSGGKSTTKQSSGSSDGMVTIAGITLRKENAEAFKDGLIDGATGMSDGEYTQPTHSSPYYAVAHMGSGFVPGLGDAADVRDGIQHADNGKWGEALLSGAAAIPIIGTGANGMKAVDFAKDWIGKFGSKAGTLTKLLAKHVAKYMPDDLVVKLLDVFSGGKASKLKESGKSVDEIVDRAKKGSLEKKPKKNPNDGKRLVADGGSTKIPKGV